MIFCSNCFVTTIICASLVLLWLPYDAIQLMMIFFFRHGSRSIWKPLKIECPFVASNSNSKHNSSLLTICTNMNRSHPYNLRPNARRLAALRGVVGDDDVISISSSSTAPLPSRWITASRRRRERKEQPELLFPECFEYRRQRLSQWLAALSDSDSGGRQLNTMMNPIRSIMNSIRTTMSPIKSTMSPIRPTMNPIRSTMNQTHQTNCYYCCQSFLNWIQN